MTTRRPAPLELKDIPADVLMDNAMLTYWDGERFRDFADWPAFIFVSEDEVRCPQCLYRDDPRPNEPPQDYEHICNQCGYPMKITVTEQDGWPIFASEPERRRRRR